MAGGMNVAVDPTDFSGLQVSLCDQFGNELTPRAAVSPDGSFKLPKATTRPTESAFKAVYWAANGTKVRETIMKSRRMITPGDEFDETVLL
jgi:hypothetical protein